MRSAQVPAEQSATALKRTTSTNSDGLVVLNDLVPGRYAVQVQADGSSDFIAAARVEVGQQANLKLSLTMRAQPTPVDVRGAARQVDTVSSVVDGVVNAQQIDNLPWNGRNFFELALLMPGNIIAPNFDPTEFLSRA
jgi:hypothetical protein